MFDTHCHFDAYDDPVSALAEVSDAAGRANWVTTVPSQVPVFGNILAAQPRAVQAAVTVTPGLHPQAVGRLEKARGDAEQLGRIIAATPPGGWVGEVGLDGGPLHRASLSVQRETANIWMRALAEHEGGLSVTLHGRHAWEELLAWLRDHTQILDRHRFCVHWFTGTRELLRGLADLGCWFSVNPQMCRSSSQRKLLPHLPPGRVLLETDGPYATLPVTRGGGHWVQRRPCRHGDLEHVIHHLKSLRLWTQEATSYRV